MIDKDYIEKLTSRIPDLEAQMSDPKVMSDQKRVRKLVKEHSALKKLENKSSSYFEIKKNIEDNTELINSGDEGDPEIIEMAKEEMAELEENFVKAEKELIVALVPPDPDDDRNAIVEIRAGTGGSEAALFAGDLFRMYSRYAEIHGWKIDTIDASASEIGGYKEIVFSVEGKDVYGTLRFEMGGHRVQRVPLTESSGRIHTSAATVAVFPESEDDDDIDIGPEDVRVDIFRSSGPGGQSVNCTDSACRLTHLPTGITVQCQDEKSQHKNKAKAMTVLKARVLDLKRREEAEKMGAERRSQIGSGDRSQRIRTYNFPQNRLSDHRINLTLYSLDRIVEGELQALIDALKAHNAEVRLNEELKSMGQD